MRRDALEGYCSDQHVGLAALRGVWGLWGLWVNLIVQNKQQMSEKRIATSTYAAGFSGLIRSRQVIPQVLRSKLRYSLI